MIDHGLFTPYEHPSPAAPGAIHLRREDERDFYEHRNELVGHATGFHPLTGEECGRQDHGTFLGVAGGGIVMLATNDVDRLFPQNLRMIEVDRVDDPQALVGKVLTADGTIGEMAAQPDPPHMAHRRSAVAKLAFFAGLEPHEVEALLV